MYQENRHVYFAVIPHRLGQYHNQEKALRCTVLATIEAIQYILRDSQLH